MSNLTRREHFALEFMKIYSAMDGNELLGIMNQARLMFKNVDSLQALAVNSADQLIAELDGKNV